MSFLLWRPGRSTDGICKILEIEGVEKSFELAEGVSRATGWPDDAQCQMDPNRPKDIALADSLLGAKLVVVSAKVKRALDDAHSKNVEFLPIKIINHKGRVASDEYFVLNPLEICDCIDVQQSNVEWNDLDPEAICACDALILKESAVPESLSVFRLKHWKNLIVIRRSLAESMLSQGLTGLNFLEPEEYMGLG
ncbi:imm11 family protein [Chondromyces apiculatus]|uniref:Immunity MXAN-0049 protein domain-containing protein n=1 Tax=Chondromyces apiculatus DSM 436 TaxID=1192034 RepID=A0A017TDZ8_9BACT|nr:DUF1629 domain-containing protein [Chondromyces apiculatus]EYF06841.1 Hypothetical protein CAP_1538 [Chondromyces apiculatus DSM 436]